MKIETSQTVRLSHEEFQILDKAADIVEDIVNGLDENYEGYKKEFYQELLDHLVGATCDAEPEVDPAEEEEKEE